MDTNAASSKADNWDWYFITLGCDVCIGVFIWYCLLQIVEKFASKFGITALNTGVYVNMDYEKDYVAELDPTQQTEVANVNYWIYFTQIIEWGIIVMISKVFLFFIQQHFSEYLIFFWFLWIGWLNLMPRVKLIVVMVS